MEGPKDWSNIESINSSLSNLHSNKNLPLFVAICNHKLQIPINQQLSQIPFQYLLTIPRHRRLSQIPQ